MDVRVTLVEYRVLGWIEVDSLMSFVDDDEVMELVSRVLVAVEPRVEDSVRVRVDVETRVKTPGVRELVDGVVLRTVVGSLVEVFGMSVDERLVDVIMDLDDEAKRVGCSVLVVDVEAIRDMVTGAVGRIDGVLDLNIYANVVSRSVTVHITPGRGYTPM